MRPGDLTPNATVMAPVLLYLSLVNVSQTLPGVPCHLLLGVDVLDLNQGRVWILVRFRPGRNETLSQIQTIPELKSQISKWLELCYSTSCIRGRFHGRRVCREIENRNELDFNLWILEEITEMGD